MLYLFIDLIVGTFSAFIYLGLCFRLFVSIFIDDLFLPVFALCDLSIQVIYMFLFDHLLEASSSAFIQFRFSLEIYQLVQIFSLGLGCVLIYLPVMFTAYCFASTFLFLLFTSAAYLFSLLSFTSQQFMHTALVYVSLLSYMFVIVQYQALVLCLPVFICYQFHVVYLFRWFRI